MWHAFWRLDTTRTKSSGGPNPIGLNDIISYARGVLKLDDVEDFVDYIIAMDIVRLRHVYKKGDK